MFQPLFSTVLIENISKKKQAKFNEPRRQAMGSLQRLSEAFFLFVLMGSVYYLLALLSFSPLDPGWSQTSWQGPTRNLGGSFGAWLSDVSLFSFGLFAYLLPFLMMYLSWGLLVQSKKTWYQISFVVLSCQLCGFMLLLIGFTGLCALSHTEIYAFPTGGATGQVIEQFCLPIFQRIGSVLVFLLALLVGFTCLTGYSWLWLIERLGALIRQVVSGIHGRSYEKEHPIAKNANVVANGSQEIRREPHLGATLDRKITEEENTPTPSMGLLLSKKEKSPRIKTRPSIELLDMPCEQGQSLSHDELERIARLVEEKLADYHIKVCVVGVQVGPVITRFELELAPGMKANKITSLVKDLARSLSAASVRVVEVIPSKPYVGLEIPNPYRQTVYLRSIFSHAAFCEASDPMTLALGADINGQPVVVSLAKMPHLLVAGTTGSGKSVGVNVMILSLLYKATPEQVRFIMIDPKMLELSIYDGIPHLLTDVVTDMKDAANALHWCVAEMERRYKLMSAVGVRNLKGFNKKIQQAFDAGAPLTDPFWQKEKSMEEIAPELTVLPQIVVVVDEFADMMMIVGKKVEELIARIAQKARAAGIHLILATQRPSVDVITGLIKANIPTRISFQVSSKIDSRTILDQQGAESLLGMGDMLYLPAGESVPMRVHGAFVDDHEVHKIVAELKKQPSVPYVCAVDSTVVSDGNSVFADVQENDELDPLFDQAVEFVVTARRGSTSSVQRRFKIGYNRAARIIEQMESQGIVSALGTNGQREVLAPRPPGEND